MELSDKSAPINLLSEKYTERSKSKEIETVFEIENVTREVDVYLVTCPLSSVKYFISFVKNSLKCFFKL